jgi:predicted Zn-dependent protease
MIGREKLLNSLRSVLDASEAEQTEVTCFAQDSGLTRFANSAIHQNVAETNQRVIVRCVIGNRIGVAVTNSLNKAELVQTVRNACSIAKMRPENPDWPGLPKPAKYKMLDNFDEATAKASPMQRARAVKSMIKITDRLKQGAAGALSTTVTETAVVNSNGVEAYHAGTSASVNFIAMSDDSSGYGAGLSPALGSLDTKGLAAVAAEKCRRSVHPQSIDPGEYEVILEPVAVASLLEWLNYVGLRNKPVLQKMSLLSGKFGKKITSELVSWYDNAFEPGGIGLPFDFEGVPRRKVMYIDKGVATDTVWDRLSAAKEGRKPTGHAYTADQMGEGGIGLNLCMRAGTAKREEMIRSVKKGILVTRFHYINGFIDQPRGVLTGMTRDGTFLIRNGEIVCGIKNLRFTDAMPRAFGTAVAISKERELVDSWWSSIGCAIAPAVHLKSFRFSGKTDF